MSDDPEVSAGLDAAPQRLARSLDRLLAGLGGTGPAPGDRRSVAGGGAAVASGASGLFSRWAELVGPEIAAHARLIGVQSGHLVVATDDPAWASQLRWLESELLARIVAGGGPRFEGLQVRVRPATRRSGSA